MTAMSAACRAACEGGKIARRDEDGLLVENLMASFTGISIKLGFWRCRF